MQNVTGAIACPTSPPLSSTAHTIQVSRVDRWFVYHRLQELTIPCWCLEDGTLRVEIQDSLTAVLIRSVVQHCIAPRHELITWLERCWHS